MPMAFSTKGGVRAWRFEDLNASLVAKRKGWRTNKDLDAGLAALKKQQADPAWIDATLARMPVTALALLATLVQSHGHESDEEILRDAGQTFEIPSHEMS
jgi:hypothetical protein